MEAIVEKEIEVAFNNISLSEHRVKSLMFYTSIERTNHQNHIMCTSIEKIPKN